MNLTEKKYKLWQLRIFLLCGYGIASLSMINIFVKDRIYFVMNTRIYLPKKKTIFIKLNNNNSMEKVLWLLKLVFVI